MPLTPDERKMRLGHGGLALVARRTKRTEGHVSQVNRGLRPDKKVERAITRLIIEKHPDISPDQVWSVAS
ncbi:MAG: hypothetical protein JWM95_4018 [Gemmatimonadetes bacterium]|nr:hypothetical protein [Gemmatimonadota bacterium]